MFTSAKTSNHTRMHDVETGNKLNTYYEGRSYWTTFLAEKEMSRLQRVYLCVSAFKILKQMTDIHETQHEHCGTEGHPNTLL